MGFTEKAFDYFATLTRSILKNRKETNVKRGDLVQLLMDAFVYDSDLKSATYENLTVDTDKDSKVLRQFIFNETL